MGFLVRAFAMLNSAREWFSFANDAKNWFTVSQRVAAATAGIAAIAAPVALLSAKPAEPVQPVAGTQAPVVATVPATKEVKIDPDRVYTQAFLQQPENKELLAMLMEKCKAGAPEISNEQCKTAMNANGALILMRLGEAKRQREQQNRESLATQKVEGGDVVNLKLFKD